MDVKYNKAGLSPLESGYTGGRIHESSDLQLMSSKSLLESASSDKGVIPPIPQMGLLVNNSRVMAPYDSRSWDSVICVSSKHLRCL